MKLTDEEPTPSVRKHDLVELAREVARISLQEQKSVILQRGVDFWGTEKSVQNFMYQFARRNGLRAVSNIRKNDEFLIRFYREDDPKPKRAGMITTFVRQ